jgi:hypothetical protein
MSDASTLRLRIFDGSRQLFSKPASFLVRIVDGNQRQQVWKEFPQNDLTFTNLPFYDNLFDNYTVLVSTDGYKQAGYHPVKPSSHYVTTLDIMLIPDDPGFSFVNARWPSAKSAYPFLASPMCPTVPAKRAMTIFRPIGKVPCLPQPRRRQYDQIPLSQGNLLDYIKSSADLVLAPAQGLFFACGTSPLSISESCRRRRKVRRRDGPRPPPRRDVQLEADPPTANVQPTFHENDKLVIDGVNCVMLETDRIHRTVTSSPRPASHSHLTQPS